MPKGATRHEEPPPPPILPDKGYDPVSYETRSRQARAASLGFWSPIDGEDGPRTRRAMADATEAQRERGLPFMHPSGLTRIHIHWTAGAHKAAAADRRSYHYVVEGDGTAIQCHEPTVRLSHTLNANGGAIAVSLCAMAGATERPWNPGAYPIRSAQLASMARTVAVLCRAYDIPVTRYSVLTHAEVQPTLGIRQRGKWDICWIPGMDRPADPVSVGDRLRDMIRRAMRGLP